MTGRVGSQQFFQQLTYSSVPNETQDCKKSYTALKMPEVNSKCQLPCQQLIKALEMALEKLQFERLLGHLGSRVLAPFLLRPRAQESNPEQHKTVDCNHVRL